MKSKFELFFCFFISFIFFSCATTLNYSAKRPANLNLNGASSISVLTFKTNGSTSYYDFDSPRNILDFFIEFICENPDETDTVNYIKSYLEREILNSDYYKLIYSKDIENDIKTKSSKYLPDIYLTGEVILFDVTDEKIFDTIEANPGSKDKGPKPINPKTEEFEKRLPPEKKDKITVQKFKRHVRFSFIYEIIDSSTNQIISYKEVKIDNTSNEYSNPLSLPKPLDIIETDLNRSLRKIIKDIQPYYEDKTLKFIKNRSYKQEFSTAEAYLNSSDFDQAENLYLNLYSEQNVMEAGYDAALLMEYSGKLQDAKELIQEISERTTDKSLLKKCNKALIDIQKEISFKIKLNEQNIDRKERLGN